MTLIQMYNAILAVYEANDNYLFGVRYENKVREIGEECEWSKHNPDRDDEREFPRFGSEEYDDLPTLNGTSVWHFEPSRSRILLPGYGVLREKDYDLQVESCFLVDNCYIVAGEKQGYHDDPDAGEILIKDAVVVAKLF